MQEATRYAFGPFELEPAERTLRRHGELVDLPPKTFDLLTALVRRGGRLASRAELIDELWPSTIVEENALSVYVSKLRAALGESAREGRFIETVPRAGYRLAVEVTSLPPRAPGAPPGVPRRQRGPRLVRGSALTVVVLLALTAAIWAWRAPPPDAAAVRSIAVMPLEGLGADEHEDLGLALADALITQLAAIDGLSVRPTHAVEPFTGRDARETGRALRTDAVLRGRLQREGERLRVTLQLVRSEDGHALWSRAFSADGTNLLALQDALATEAVRALAPDLAPAERQRVDRQIPRSAAAHEAYLRGRHAASRRTGADLRRALAAFRETVAEEPTFAPAYAQMARAYALLVWYDGVHPREAFPRSRAAAEAARRLDPSLAEALLPLASAAWLYDRDEARAETAFREAVRREPQLATAHHQLGEFLALTGRLAEGLIHLERARALDPLSPVIAVDAGSAYLFNGQPTEAIRRYRAVLDLDPDFALARVFLATAYDSVGEVDAAVEQIDLAVGAGGQPPLWLAVQARAYARAGRTSEARDILQAIETLAASRFVSPVALALAHDGLGDRDAALAAIAHAEDLRDPMRIYLPTHPGLAWLRDV